VSALERSGQLIDIVTSKTSALTEGKMTVGSFFVGLDRLRTINPEINQNTLGLIYDCII
jgi:magnesium-transporting ATPase (P-type)